MSKGFRFCMVLAVLLGAGLRFAELDNRPMHTDESVNAMKLGQLWWDGYYRYDPSEHHGPSLAYASLAWQKLTLAPDFALWGDIRLRSLTVVFGIGLILLLPLVGDGLGRNGALSAAFLTAVSPVMVYYSRDYIHEILLVFFTFLALVSGWRYLRERKLRWALLTGVGIGLMQATKETFVFNLAAAAGAGLLLSFFKPKQNPVNKKSSAVSRLNMWHLAVALAAWLVVALLLFSSFFSNASGPLDAIVTYKYWLQSAGGATTHVHPWSFYAERLLFFHAKAGPAWSESFILVLAVIGGVVAFGRGELAGANAGFVRFLVFYTSILAVIYSALPYKTPWCVLGFWHGAILLAGVGASVLVRRLRQPMQKIAALSVIILGSAHLAFEAWQASTTYSADQGNPWCYAQTSRDLLNLVSKVKELASVSPQGGGMRINVIAPGDDWWPLPWYLRRFGASDWWDEIPHDYTNETSDINSLNAAVSLQNTGQKTDAGHVDIYPPVLIISRNLEAGLDTNKAGVGPTYYQLRPGTFLALYVQSNLWSANLNAVKNNSSGATPSPSRP